MKMNTFRFACYFFNNLANWLTVTVDTVWREAYNEDSHELCETHKFKKLKYFSRRMIIMKKDALTEHTELFHQKVFYLSQQMSLTTQWKSMTTKY